MSGVSREQINRAKQVNILDYILTHEPNNVKRVGKAHYLIDHDSLRISNGLWIWESQGIGGRNVVDYLIKVRGYSFVEAVRHLTGEHTSHIDKVEIIKMIPEQFIKLPPRNKNNDRAIAYLQKRGIAKQVIFDCIKRGSVYESALWHNCVFVGRDEIGAPRYATMRGTMGEFKRDADGSDKRYGFTLPPIHSKSDTVAVFESAVDCLSHQTLYPGFEGWRLSLGGTSLSSLKKFRENHGEVKSIIVCTDNDKAGNNAAKRIEELNCTTITRSLPPAGHKDWNDALVSVRGKPSILMQLKEAKVLADKNNAQISIDKRDLLQERR